MPPPPKSKRAADPDSKARFAADLTTVAGRAAVDHDRFGVAVSGGPDSMALLHLAHACLGKRMAAATIDHGLRDGSASEADMVANWCADEGIDHAILRPAQAITGSLQAAAREARYLLLHEWREAAGLQWLLTAHHADDQIETLFMRLNRGSGVGGLAGIRTRNGETLRPLLRWQSSELRALCQAHGLPFIDDPSNADQRFDRVAMRQALAGRQMFDVLNPASLVQSADALDAADRALDWTARHLIAGWPESADPLAIRDDGYPPELMRRIVTLRLTALDPAPDLRGPVLTRLLGQMADRRPAMIGDWRIVLHPESVFLWRILRARPRKLRQTG